MDKKSSACATAWPPANRQLNTYDLRILLFLHKIYLKTTIKNLNAAAMLRNYQHMGGRMVDGEATNLIPLGNEIQ